MARASPPSEGASLQGTAREKRFYTRIELLKLSQLVQPVLPRGFPEFKAWFGETPPQTSPIVNKRDIHHSNGRYDHSDQNSRSNRTPRRAPSPSSASINITSSTTSSAPFTRERAPHHRDNAASDGLPSSGRDRTERDKEREARPVGGSDGRNHFKNPFGNADMLMGNFRIGSRTGGNLSEREKREDEDGGLKKLSDTYDRFSRKSPNARHADLPSATSAASLKNGLASDRRTTNGALGNDRRKGGPGGDDDKKDKAERESASEKREKFERERAERKAERSEDWRRGTSTLPSRPGGPPAQSSASSPSTFTKVPGRPSWNPAPLANSASSPRPNVHRRGESEDDAQEPAWMGEWVPAKPSKDRTGGKGGGDNEGEEEGDEGAVEEEDVIQKFKREMKEREARRNGAAAPILQSTKEGDGEEDGREGGKREDGKEEMPTSLSIGSFSIPLSNTSHCSAASTPTATTSAPPGLIASRPPLNSTASQPVIPSALLVPPNTRTAPQSNLPSLALPSASTTGISSSTPSTPFSDPAILSSTSAGGLQPRSTAMAGGADASGAGRRGGSRFAKFFVEGAGKAKDGSATASDAGGTGSVGGLAALLAGASEGGGDAGSGGGGDAQMNKLLAMLTSSKPINSPNLGAHPSPSTTPLLQSAPTSSTFSASHPSTSPRPPPSSQQTSPLVSSAAPSLRRPAEPMPTPVAFPPMDPNHIPLHLRQPSASNSNFAPYPQQPIRQPSSTAGNNPNLEALLSPPIPGRGLSPSGNASSGYPSHSPYHPHQQPSPHTLPPTVVRSSSSSTNFPSPQLPFTDPRLLQQQQSLLLERQQNHLASLLSTQQPPPRSGSSPQPHLPHHLQSASKPHPYGGVDPSARLQQILEAQHLHRGGPALPPPHIQQHPSFPSSAAGGAAAFERLRELGSMGGGNGNSYQQGQAYPPHLTHQFASQRFEGAAAGGGGYNAYLQQQPYGAYGSPAGGFGGRGGEGR